MVCIIIYCGITYRFVQMSNVDFSSKSGLNLKSIIGKDDICPDDSPIGKVN